MGFHQRGFRLQHSLDEFVYCAACDHIGDVNSDCLSDTIGAILCLPVTGTQSKSLKTICRPAVRLIPTPATCILAIKSLTFSRVLEPVNPILPSSADRTFGLTGDEDGSGRRNACENALSSVLRNRGEQNNRLSENLPFQGVFDEFDGVSALSAKASFRRAVVSLPTARRRSEFSGTCFKGSQQVQGHQISSRILVTALWKC